MSVSNLFPIAALRAFGATLFARLRRLRRASPTPPIVEDQSEDGPPPPPPEALSVALGRLGEALEPRADKSSNPQEMVDWPEFQAAVQAFRRLDASLEVLRHYALGDNWPLACAAMAALPSHPKASELAQRVVAQLGKIRPWTLFFALRYLSQIERRPPVGAAAAVAPRWWSVNPLIPDFFREYFERCGGKGDAATFGEHLDEGHRSEPQHIEALLRKVDHPFSAPLLEELRRWRAQLVDRAFLTSFGRFWDAGGEERLLVEAAGWREALDQAERAILHDPPRSIMATGDPSVGKTTFLRLLAIRLRRRGCSVFEASGAELQADQIYTGQLEGRIRQLVAELEWRKRIVWHVDDLLQIAESGTHKGQSASILDQILPALASGQLVLFGETSAAGAVRLFQLRPALRAAIEVCRLEPMDEEAAAELALEVAARIEHHLKLRIGKDAVGLALELSQHYLGSGQLPGALIELLRRAAARALQARAPELAPDQVVATLSQITGLPRSILDDKERVELKSVEAFFAARVVGQEEAVRAIVDRIAMLKAGLVDPHRPVGVFLFAGPTGTGKTELAKTLAEFLFGTPDRMARLDMSEFQTPEATGKILGQSGNAHTVSLIERVRRQPFSVILLDEFEKAHPNTWDLFLQIFDDGRLTDANGRTCDFRHTIIILTSNLGATVHRGGGVGFLPGDAPYDQDQVLRAIAQTFRPEFVNRLDKIIVFRPLSRELMRNILRKELAQVLERRGLRRRDWAVEWESSAIEFLLDRGFSPEMGARPLKRAIDQHLLAPLAATLVEHRFPEGDQFLFVRSNGKALEVEFVDPDEDEGTGAERSPASADRISLATMILRPVGSSEEVAGLGAAWTLLSARLEAADWTALRDDLQAQIMEPEFWSRSDRLAVLARRELMDRVGEAARTAERLKQRLASGGTGKARISRSMIARLALQLHLAEDGIADALADAPIDALVTAEPALEGGADAAAQAAWCGQLLRMYRQWAERRHMQLAEHAAPGGRAGLILQIGGFGAFRTLEREAGLHVLEDPEVEDGRRTVARIRVVAGPLEDPKPAEARREFERLLARAREASGVVRRYRGGAAPLVRDVKGGWRSGRLDAVLDGDFDLIGAMRQAEA